MESISSHLPSDIVTSIMSGQTVGATIEPSSPQNVAWIQINASIDKHKCFVRRNDKDRRLEIIPNSSANPIVGFILRRIEIDKKYLNYAWDYDQYASVYEEVEATTQEELEDELARFISDFSRLKVYEDAIGKWLLSQT